MRFGLRLGLSALLVAVVAAGGFALERGLGPAPVAASSPAVGRTGAWFCPHGGLWRTWVVGNPWEESTRVRVRTFGPKGELATTDFDLGGEEQRYVEVPASGAGGGSIVEYFGRSVGAGWVSRGGGDVAAESCRSSAARSWYLADATTRRGRDAYIVVMNPFAEAAAFDVTLLSDERAPVRAGRLRGFVLEGRRAVAFRVSPLLLDVPSIAATVQVSLGAVSAALLATTEGVGIRAVNGVTRPATEWIVPGVAGETAVSVVDTALSRTAVAVGVQTDTEQRPVEELADVTLRPQSSRTLVAELPEEPVSLTVRATGTVPVVVAARAPGPEDGIGGLAGVARSARAWLVPPAVLPDEDGGQLLVLENPSRDPARIRVRLFGESVGDLGTIEVGPGRTVVLDVGEDSTGPVWGWLRAEAGTFVAATASTSLDGRGYALSLGQPVPDGGV